MYDQGSLPTPRTIPCSSASRSGDCARARSPPSRRGGPSNPSRTPTRRRIRPTLPQYRIPQQSQATALNAKADAYFAAGESAAQTADKYVRLTVFLAAVLFLVGIGSRLPLPAARYGLVGVATVFFVVSVVELLSLRGPPS